MGLILGVPSAAGECTPIVGSGGIQYCMEPGPGVDENYLAHKYGVIVDVETNEEGLVTGFWVTSPIGTVHVVLTYTTEFLSQLIMDAYTMQLNVRLSHNVENGRNVLNWIDVQYIVPTGVSWNLCVAPYRQADRPTTIGGHRTECYPACYQYSSAPDPLWVWHPVRIPLVPRLLPRFDPGGPPGLSQRVTTAASPVGEARTERAPAKRIDIGADEFGGVALAAGETRSLRSPADRVDIGADEFGGAVAAARPWTDPEQEELGGAIRDKYDKIRPGDPTSGNGNGRIDGPELRRLIADLDPDHDNIITPAEILNWLTQVLGMDQVKANRILAWLMASYDSNADGVLSLGEFGRFIRDINRPYDNWILVQPVDGRPDAAIQPAGAAGDGLNQKE